MLVNILVSIMYCAVCVLFYGYLQKHSHNKGAISHKLFAVLVAAAALLRLYFAAQDYYFPTDVGNFSAWGTFAVNHGLGQMYKQGYFIDYPPGYMYPLYLLTKLNNLLGFEYGSTMYAFVIKLPAMIADFGCAYLLYKMCEKPQGENFAKFAAIVFLYMPVVITNSSMWGQIESFFILFVAISIWSAYRDKTIPSAISFAYALSIKPQAILFGPVLLFYIVKRKSIKEFFKAVCTGLLSFYLIVLPFCEKMLDIGWIIKLYPSSMNTYRLVTVNGYNLYYLFGLNWADSSVLPQGVVINFAVIAFCVAFTGWMMLKNRDRSAFFATAAVTVSMMFCFCTMMHERYIWPALFFTLAAWAVTGKKWYLVFSVLFGTLNQFNTSWVLAQYQNAYWPPEAACKAVALLTVVVTVCYVIYLAKETLRETGEEKLMFNLKNKIRIKNEKTLVAAITAIYAVIALAGLGSIKAPQSFYQSTEYDDGFAVTFDNPADIGKVYVYSGLGDETAAPYGRKVCGEFGVECSADGENFEYLCDIENQSVYTWKEYPVTAYQVSQIKVTAKNAGAVVHEIVFEDMSGNVINGKITGLVTDGTNPYTAANAFDEQYTAPKDTSCYYSMYFDEIYHARTAYEQLNGMQIYETTHPPLGKIIIGIGIALFGMTPFGWRVAGTVCGVIMLPVIYLLARELAGKKAALAALLLMALDFMHLTQTRIATVDTFVVLFCMLTFLFMVRYSKAEFGDIKKEFSCLLLSGIFMGCTVASKWNGAYPMVALAVIFFVVLWVKYKNSAGKKADILYAAKTVAFCFVAFVLVPAVIYAASYLPVIKAYTVQDWLRQLVNYQKHMFDYHANLEAEHFFSSMWYSWPLNIKPVWYSVANTATGWVRTISAFGNPLIWIFTPAAAFYCLYKAVKTKQTGGLVPSLGYLASYIPWIAVTRLCFIYHYFPCAMFGIVCMALAIDDVIKNKPQSKKFVAAYLALCLVLFVMFLPVTTGWAAPKWYIEFLEFMPDWYFVN